MTLAHRKVRGYRQTARAASTERTRSAILDSLDTAFIEHADAFTLEQVAVGAGTTVQTVLRHFASKEGLLSAGAATAGRIRAALLRRAVARPGRRLVEAV